MNDNRPIFGTHIQSVFPVSTYLPESERTTGITRRIYSYVRAKVLKGFSLYCACAHYSVCRTYVYCTALRETMAETSGSALVNFLSDPATLVGLGVVAAGAAYYLSSRATPIVPPVPLSNQSLEIPVRFSSITRPAVTTNTCNNS